MNDVSTRSPQTQDIAADDDPRPASRSQKRGLAMSGGGYRASLFHVGSLLRLNELGWLPQLDEIASVSGGSIASAYLGLKWKKLDFDERGVATNFAAEYVDPMRRMCGITIDLGAIAGGALNPFGTIGGKLGTRGLVDLSIEVLSDLLPQALVDGFAKPVGRAASAGVEATGKLLDLNPFPSPSDNLIRAYDRELFGKACIQDLPDPTHPGNPRITLYATNMQTGVSFRIARDYVADYRLGKVVRPKIPLARAVAASSSFPPFFSPVELKFQASDWQRWDDDSCDLNDQEHLRTNVDLADGAVYDNLGMERLIHTCETVLISDAGPPLAVLPALPFDWLRQALRTTTVVMDQVAKLRKRMFVDGLMRGSFLGKPLKGTYWGIDTEIARYGLKDQGQPVELLGDCPETRELAWMRTRLDKFLPEEQKSLINWGYALADAGMRRWVTADATPGRLPYPGFPLNARFDNGSG